MFLKGGETFSSISNFANRNINPFFSPKNEKSYDEANNPNRNLAVTKGIGLCFEKNECRGRIFGALSLI